MTVLAIESVALLPVCTLPFMVTVIAYSLIFSWLSTFGISDHQNKLIILFQGEKHQKEPTPVILVNTYIFTNFNLWIVNTF